MFRDGEVAELDLAMSVYKDVRRLDVAVHNAVLFVEVDQAT